MLELQGRRLIFVHGKGGVGKTTISRAIARAQAGPGRKVLWVTFEAPDLPEGEVFKAGPGLWELNCVPGRAFEEYAGLLIHNAILARLFLRNRVVDYLSKAAPGIREITQLGKVWYERENYEHIVVDLPSTGYAIAMFNSVFNFGELFRGGPIHRDALQMQKTFGDARESAHLIVSIPEEMALRESTDLATQLAKFFPSNPAQYLLNKRFPEVRVPGPQPPPTPADWPSLLPASLSEYALKRRLLETHNLRLWDFAFTELPQLPSDGRDPDTLVSSLADKLKEAGVR